MKKPGIELNGIANIKILMQMEIDTHIDGSRVYLEMNKETYDTILDQVELLERYMLAYHQAILDGKNPPMWHEVRENKHSYPTNRERFGA